MTFLRYECDGGTWDLTEAQLALWESVYEGVNVRFEVRKAALWMDANPRKRATPRGMKRFLVSWLNRCKPAPPVVEKKGDWYGHWPPCESWKACTERILAEERAKRMA